MHRFWFWWSAIFGPICLVWSVWMATGMHWLVAGLSAGSGVLHGGAAQFHRGKIPPRIPPPSRHDLCLADIDRLERELRVGAHAKTQAEFDREIGAAVRPFRLFLTDLTRSLLVLAVTRSRRRTRYLTTYGLPGTPSSGTGRRGQLSADQLYGQAIASMIQAIIGADRKK